MNEWRRQTTRHLSQMTRAYLSTPPPVLPKVERCSRQCLERHCLTWVFGDTAEEAADRLAAHRRNRHA